MNKAKTTLCVFVVLLAVSSFSVSQTCGQKNCYFVGDTETGNIGNRNFSWTCVPGTIPDQGCTVLNQYQCDTTCTSAESGKVCDSTIQEVRDDLKLNNSGINFALLRIGGSPLGLSNALFSSRGSAFKVMLNNKSKNDVVGYRISWMTFARSGTRAISSSEWVKLDDPLPPGGVRQIVGYGGNLSKLIIGHPLTLAFFIAEVEFKDGTRWHAEVPELNASKASKRQM